MRDVLQKTGGYRLWTLNHRKEICCGSSHQLTAFQPQTPNELQQEFLTSYSKQCVSGSWIIWPFTAWLHLHDTAVTLPKGKYQLLWGHRKMCPLLTCKIYLENGILRKNNELFTLLPINLIKRKTMTFGWKTEILSAEWCLICQTSYLSFPLNQPTAFSLFVFLFLNIDVLQSFSLAKTTSDSSAVLPWAAVLSDHIQESSACTGTSKRLPRHCEEQQGWFSEQQSCSSDQEPPIPGATAFAAAAAVSAETQDSDVHHFSSLDAPSQTSPLSKSRENHWNHISHIVLLKEEKELEAE